MLKWGISLKQLVVLQMFVGVFIPWGQMTSFSVGGLLLALVVAVVKLVAGVLILPCLKTAWRACAFVPRPRYLGRFWLAFLAFVSLLMA
ncbi:Hydrogenase 3 component D [Raoultella terrigena]|uniref:Hydrogenase 3 component D n=1 Tax=Raoultella terrigena TaxID=577 RepID=A0A4U9D5Y5_RAOTE|nr:Hydrogenase 3 component D [Raoultella terrigena]